VRLALPEVRKKICTLVKDSRAHVTIRRRIEMERGVNPNRLPSRVKGKISVGPTVTKVVINRYFPENS